MISIIDSKNKILGNRLLTFCSEIELILTDIMPMIHKAWNKSLADVKSNQEAIVEHGLSPLNRNLLLDASFCWTIIQFDKKQEAITSLVTLEKFPMVIEGDCSKVPSIANDTNANRNIVLNFNEGYGSVIIN